MSPLKSQTCHASLRVIILLYTERFPRLARLARLLTIAAAHPPRAALSPLGNLVFPEQRIFFFSRFTYIFFFQPGHISLPLCFPASHYLPFLHYVVDNFLCRCDHFFFCFLREFQTVFFLFPWSLWSYLITEFNVSTTH